MKNQPKLLLRCKARKPPFAALEQCTEVKSVTLSEGCNQFFRITHLRSAFCSHCCYLQDGTIGDDLVVKPMSSAVRSHIDKSFANEYKSQPFSEEFLLEDQDFVLERRRTTDTDDYEFLDETDDIDDEDVMMQRAPRRQRIQRRPIQRRQKRDAINANYHVVFKRKDGNLQHSSDYGKTQMGSKVEILVVHVQMTHLKVLFKDESSRNSMDLSHDVGPLFREFSHVKTVLRDKSSQICTRILVQCHYHTK